MDYFYITHSCSFYIFNLQTFRTELYSVSQAGLQLTVILPLPLSDTTTGVCHFSWPRFIDLFSPVALLFAYLYKWLYTIILVILAE